MAHLDRPWTTCEGKVVPAFIVFDLHELPSDLSMAQLDHCFLDTPHHP